jgi:N-acetylneuraminic acid mutarotase
MVKNEMISIELAPTGNGNNSNESGPSAASASSVVALQAQVVSLKKSHNRLLGGFLLVLILAIVGLALGAKEAVKAGLVSRSDVLLDGSPKAIRGYTEGVAVYQGMGEWVTKAKLPEALSDMAVVECGGKIYLLGGMTKDGATGALTNTTIAYDPIYETSSFMAPMPNPRYRFGAACDDGVIYVAGGFTYKQGFGADATAIVEAYNVTSNTWTAMANASMGRGDVAVSAANGKLYVIGGYGPDYDMSASGTMTEELDIASNTWTVKAAMPTSRGDVSAVAIGGEIYVVGGWSQSVYPANPDPLTTLEKYSPATDTWTVLPAMFVPRGDAAVVVADGPDGPMLMVAGGVTVSAI